MDSMEMFPYGAPPSSPPGKTSSSSSSSSGSSSSSSSSSSGSDSESENEKVQSRPGEDNRPALGIPPPPQAEPVPKNVVARGSVVNDKIRVVPIKEKAVKKPKKKRIKKCPQDILAEKEDPTFRVKLSPPPFGQQALNTGALEEGEGSNGSMSSGTLAVRAEMVQRSLRNRENIPKRIVDEGILYSLRRDLDHKEEKKMGRKLSSKPAKDKKPKGRSADEDFVSGGQSPYTVLRKSGRTSDWEAFLRKPKNASWVLPVNFFKHAPMCRLWSQYARIGLKIEVPNPFIICDRPVYWVATIESFAGYKAFIKYETFGTGARENYVSWMSFMSDVPRPIGYCDKNGILLLPPPEIMKQHPDFLSKMREIVNAEDTITVPDNHAEIVAKEITALRRFSIMQVVEAMNCNDPSENYLCHITAIVGDRVHVTYLSKEDPTDPGFWFNVNSGRIHEVGWSQTVGHSIVNVPKTAKFEPLDSKCFPDYPKNIKLNRGMMFEVIHPFNLDRLACGRVSNVLRHGYFMAEINCPPFKDLTICFHITSPWVLPCGFAERNNIPLGLPKGERLIEGRFDWDSYCARKKVSKLDLSMLSQRPFNPFIVGMKLEAIDVRQPSYCGPATVQRVAEHLILLHFDHWPLDMSDSIQWVDAESSEIYPAGWAEMVGVNFESYPTDSEVEPTVMEITVNVRDFNQSVKESGL